MWLSILCLIALSFVFISTRAQASYIIAWGKPVGQNTPPPGLTDAVAIATGGAHSLALKSNGTVVGWGDNSYGQATPPLGLTDVVAISAGNSHSLALKNDGTVVGWGRNDFGQATPPPGLVDVAAISAGGASLALKNDGTVVEWGGEASDIPPSGLTDVIAISAGFTHHLALKSNGTVVGWGRNEFGQATPPAGLSNVVAISASSEWSLALKSDGTVVAWGNNYADQATPPPGLSDVVAISTGSGGGLALKSDGTVVGWGSKSHTFVDPPEGLSGVTAIASHTYHNLALTSTPYVDTNPPTLQSVGMIRTPDGQRPVLNLEVRDTGIGLKTVQVVTMTNARTYISSFTQGLTTPLSVQVGQRNPGDFSVTIRATDLAGNISEGTFTLKDQDEDTYPDGPDCNDSNAAVNPRQFEQYNNGVDDDCNPATSDTLLDTTPPSITLAGSGRDALGHAYIDVKVQDVGIGLYDIRITHLVWAVGDVPSFIPGTKDPIIIRFTSSSQTFRSVVSLTATDAAGNIR
jgi:hypothetical protein